MVTCQDVEARLIELLEKDPPSDLVIHLQACPECQKKAAGVGTALESYGSVGG